MSSYWGVNEKQWEWEEPIIYYPVVPHLSLVNRLVGNDLLTVNKSLLFTIDESLPSILFTWNELIPIIPVYLPVANHYLPVCLPGTNEEQLGSEWLVFHLFLSNYTHFVYFIAVLQ